MAEGHVFRNDVDILGDLTVRDITYLGQSVTAGAFREVVAQGSDAHISIDLIPKGTYLVQVPVGYELNIDGTNDRAVINYGYSKAHILTLEASALAQNPTITEDQYAIVYDAVNNVWDLASVAMANVYTDGLTETAGIVRLGGDIDEALTDISLIDVGDVYLQADYGTGPAGLRVSSPIINDNRVELFYSTTGKIALQSNSFVVTANVTGAMQYAANYSGVFNTTRSIPDIAWVNTHIGGKNVNALITGPGGPQNGWVIKWDNVGGEYTLAAVASGGGGGHGIQSDGVDIPDEPKLNFTNGLVAVDDPGVASVVMLGGTLIQHTDIGGADFALAFGDASPLQSFFVRASNATASGQIGFYSVDDLDPTIVGNILLDPGEVSVNLGTLNGFTNAFNLSENNFLVQSDNPSFEGLTGSALFSANYTGLSYIQKNYGDATYAPTTGGQYWPIAGAKTFTGNITLTQSGFNTTFSGIGKVTFSPTLGGGSTPGLNVGSVAGHPTTIADADIYYNSVSQTMWIRTFNGGTGQILNAVNSIQPAAGAIPFSNGTASLTASVNLTYVSGTNLKINDNVLIGTSGAITASTRVDIRGIGTGSLIVMRIANSSNIVRHLITDEGRADWATSASIAGSTTQAYSWSNAGGTQIGNATDGAIYRFTSDIRHTGGTTTIIGGIDLNLFYSNHGSASNISYGYKVSGQLSTIVSTYRGYDSTVTHTISSGTGTHSVVSINDVYNFTGTYTGNVYGIDYNPTLTSLTGVTHYAIRTTSGCAYFQHNNLGVTSSNLTGIWLANNTPATLGNQQVSPSLVLEAQGFMTNSSLSRSVKYMQDVLPVQGTLNPQPQWRLRQSVDGGAYSTAISYLGDNGSVNSVFTVNASAFLLNATTGSTSTIQASSRLVLASVGTYVLVSGAGASAGATMAVNNQAAYTASSSALVVGATSLGAANAITLVATSSANITLNYISAVPNLNFADASSTVNLKGYVFSPSGTFSAGTLTIQGFVYDPSGLTGTPTTHYAWRSGGGSMLLGALIADTLTSGTRLDVRGIGTGTNIVFRLADNANNLIMSVLDNKAWGLNGVAPTVTQTGWTTSNLTTDRVIDANATTIDELADVLGTLVEDLKTKGVLSA